MYDPGLIPGRSRRIFSSQNVWAGSRAHPLSYSMGTTGFFPRDKAAKL